MSKKVAAETETESLEIIELCIDDLELLTRAFEVISDACEQETHTPRHAFPTIPEKLLN